MKKTVLKTVSLILTAVFALVCFEGCRENGAVGGDTSDSSYTSIGEVTDNMQSKERYIIKYNLLGGINPKQNPESYTDEDEIKLLPPIRQGYIFDGWRGTGMDGVSADAVIKKGSTGERTYVAVWKKNANVTVDKTRSDDTSSDDNIQVNPNGNEYTKPSDKGSRGENIYTVKTVKTEISTDGIKDNAYSYGVHLKMDLPDNKSFYKDRTTGYESWTVLDANGKVHFFVEVTDSDIVINPELWAKTWWHCDSWQMYIDYANRADVNTCWTFAADENKKYVRPAPSEWQVVMTDKGFNVEFAFDNKGTPFLSGDEIGFGFYYNDCTNYKNVNSYTKHTLKTSSALNPANTAYKAPDSKLQDAFRFSSESATGASGSTDIHTDDKTGDLIADILSGASPVAVIYGKNASAYTVETAEKIATMLRKYTGNVIKAVSETSKSDAEVKIYVGITENDASRRAADRINYNEFMLEIGKSEITLMGHTETELNFATLGLFACFESVRDGGKTSDLCSEYGGKTDIPGDDVPKLSALTTVTDAGEGAYMLLSEGSTEKAFDDYSNALASAGYTLYTENEMETVKCRTYFSESTVINLSFCSSDRTLRAVVEPKDKTTLPMLKAEDYTPSASCSVTQVAPCNMCYILKLDNGELVVIDSGNNGTQKYILDQLKALGGEKPVVAAWIFTHFHQDHIGGFIEFVKAGYCNDVTVKSLVYSFPEDQVLKLASSKDIENLGNWDSVLKKSEAVIYKARTGQKYYFGNAEIEILFTYEDLMPYFVYGDSSNSTSVIFSVKLAGQKLLFLGDATAASTKLTANRYKKYLKSDFVQLAHHGKGDGGTFASIYLYADADYVLYPGDSFSPSAAEKSACESAKEYFVRGNMTVTLPLPYKK